VDPVDLLSNDLAQHLMRAREDLMAQMGTLGLSAKDGWRITEEVRSTMSGTLIVLKPIHVRLAEPGLESSVHVGRDGRAIE
jgi:hypothetical protein